MTTVEEVLRAYGEGMDVNDFADQLAETLRRRLGANPRALSAHDRQVLIRVGVPVGDLDGRWPGGADRVVVDTAADLLAANSVLLSASDVADRLGRSPGRIRAAIADGSLYGVKVGRNRLPPAWQFTDDDAPLPHLRAVIAAIPRDTSAVTLARVMTEPSEELFLDGHAVSPRDWLVAGKSAAPVTMMIEQLYAW